MSDKNKQGLLSNRELGYSAIGAGLNMINPLLGTAGHFISPNVRESLAPAVKPIGNLVDSYRNPTNKNTPVSPGWNAAVEAAQAAKKNGTLLPPTGPDVPLKPDSKPTNTNNSNQSVQPSVTGRNESRRGAQGTAMSPKGPDFPALLQSLQAQGMNIGYQSNSLPTRPGANNSQKMGLGSATIASGINEGKTVNVNDPKYQQYLDGEERVGSNTVTFEQGKPEVVEQTALDATDQSRAVSGGLMDALNDKEGMLSYQRKLYGGRDAQFDRRGAAFLNGGDDSMLALRAAEYSQGYIRQNGRNFAIDAAGNPQGEFSDAGRKQLASQGYGSANGEDFLNQYKVANGIPTPAGAMSESSKAPSEVTTPNPLQIASMEYTPLDQAEFQPGNGPGIVNGKQFKLDTNYFDGPIGNTMFNGNLREPLMRY